MRVDQGESPGCGCPGCELTRASRLGAVVLSAS